MVRETQVAQQARAGADESRGTSLFIASLLVSPGKDPAEAEKIFYQELDRMKNEPATDAEMQKVQMMVRRSDVEQLEGTLGRARSLGENAVFYNDPNVINSSSDMVNKVTKADIQRVAQTYLTQNNRTVVITVPKPRTGGAQ